MIKKVSIVMFIILLFATSVSAIVPTVKYTPINDTIAEGDHIAIYNVSITNTGTKDDRFQLYTINAYWDVSPTIIIIPAGNTSTFSLQITLNDATNKLVGPQLVPITIQSLTATNDSVSENLYVYVKSSDSIAMAYSPNVFMTVTMDDKFDPRNPASVEINMVNRNPLDITDLRIVVDSKLFSKEVQTTLGPLETKTNEILLDLNKFQEPGTYDVNIKLVAQNKTITQMQKEVEIIQYSQVTEEITTVKRLFSYSEHIKLYNDGNYATVKQEQIQKNFFSGLFTKYSIKGDIVKENSVTYMSWNIPLNPQESYEIIVTTNYTSIAIIIILIIAGIIMYYIFRSPVLLYKRAKIMVSTDEGITEIRVKLHLKNRSGKEIRNVKVIDRHPKIVSLVEDNSIGSMKPTKLLSADKVHALLMWNLEALEPYEERLLSYTIRSRLNIVGNMHLHSAKVRFLTTTGERTTNSNDVTLLHKSVNTVQYEN